MSVNLNGDLSQWTWGDTFAACASGQMLADGFRLHKAGAMVHTVRRSADVPPLGVCGRIIPYSLEVEVTTADASVASTDVTAITYRGEGSEWAELAERATAPRVYVKTNTPGLYNLTLSNGPETLSFSQPFVVAVADLWTTVEVQMPPSAGVTGTDWWTDWRVGYTLAITLCAGSAVAGAVGTWQSGVRFGAPAQTNFNATVGNKFSIAGLRMRLADDDRPDFFEPPELTELAAMRYLEKSFERGTAPAAAIGFGTGELRWAALVAGIATVGAQSVRYAVPKRKAGGVTGYNPAGSGAQAATASHGDCTGTTFTDKTAFGFRAYATTPANTAVGEAIGVHWLADATPPALGVGVGS